MPTTNTASPSTCEQRQPAMSPQIGHGRPRSKHPVADCLPLGRSLSLAVATDRPPRASKRRTTARPGGHIHEPVKVGGSSRGRFNALPAAAAVPPHDEIQMSPLVGEMEGRKRSEIAHMAGPPPTATGQKGPWIVARPAPVEWSSRRARQRIAGPAAAPPATIRIGRNYSFAGGASPHRPSFFSFLFGPFCERNSQIDLRQNVFWQWNLGSAPWAVAPSSNVSAPCLVAPSYLPACRQRRRGL